MVSLKAAYPFSFLCISCARKQIEAAFPRVFRVLLPKLQIPPRKRQDAPQSTSRPRLVSFVIVLCLSSPLPMPRGVDRHLEPFYVESANPSTPEKAKLKITDPRPEEIFRKRRIGRKISDQIAHFTYPAMLRPHQPECSLNPPSKNFLRNQNVIVIWFPHQVRLLCPLPQFMWRRTGRNGTNRRLRGNSVPEP